MYGLDGVNKHIEQDKVIHLGIKLTSNYFKDSHLNFKTLQNLWLLAGPAGVNSRSIEVIDEQILLHREGVLEFNSIQVSKCPSAHLHKESGMLRLPD